MEGVSWFTNEVMQRIVDTNPEHEYYYFFDRPFDNAFIHSRQVKPIKAGPPTRHPILWYYWFERVVPRLLRKYKPDVFFSPDGFCPLHTNVPTVIVIHDIAFEHFPEHVGRLVGWYFRKYIPKYIHRAKHVVVVSDYTKNDVIERYGVSPEKITVACNGGRKEFKPILTDEKNDVRQKYAEGEHYFLFVGAIHPRKNVGRIIEAFDQYKARKKDKRKLLLVGRFSWMTSDVESKLKKSPYRSDIKLLGHVKYDLPQIVAAADALLYPSLFEGFGIPIVEAMHCETPVITSNVSSMPEVAGDAALLVDPKNVEEITTAMTKIVESETLVNELVQRGIVQRERFTWEKAANVVWEAIVNVRASD